MAQEPSGPRFGSGAAPPRGPPRARNAARHDGLWRAPAAPGARDIVYRTMEEFVFRDEHCVVHQASLGYVREGINGGDTAGRRSWVTPSRRRRSGRAGLRCAACLARRSCAGGHHGLLGVRWRLPLGVGCGAALERRRFSGLGDLACGTTAPASWPLIGAGWHRSGARVDRGWGPRGAGDPPGVELRAAGVSHGSPCCGGGSACAVVIGKKYQY